MGIRMQGGNGERVFGRRFHRRGRYSIPLARHRGMVLREQRREDASGREKGAERFRPLRYARNVWEWTNDRYGPYDPSGITNPIATLGGAGYVIRGGSWSCFPYNCRSARRTWYDPEGRYYGIGFRIVRRASR